MYQGDKGCMSYLAGKHRAIEEYKSPYPDPILFQKGDIVEVGREFTEEPDWRNWVWCEALDNRKAWAPEQYLEINENKGKFTRVYNAMELSIAAGEELYVHEIVNGFGMAEKSNGRRGWVPMKCLEPA